MKLIFGLALAGATLSLAAPFALEGGWAWALVISAIGLLWWIEIKNPGPWVPAIGLILYTGLAAFGLTTGLQRELMLLAAVLTLAAWDLDHLEQRLSLADKRENEKLIIKEHLERLLVVACIGVGIGLFALTLRFELSFWWIFLTGLLGAIALSRIINSLQQESD